MRAFLSFVAVALTATFASVAPAAAKWHCIGAAYVCGPAPSAAKHSSYAKKASYKRTPTAQKSRKAAHRVAKSSYKSKKTYRSASRKQSSGRSYASNGKGSGRTLSGKASYYWQPQRVASGGWFNPNALTAAHKTLPFGTRVRVTNRHNGKSVVVTINDRGPYIRGRIIDLSRAAAHRISMQGAGVVPVSVTILGRG